MGIFTRKRTPDKPAEEVIDPPAWLDSGPLVVLDAAFATDGGSIRLNLRDGCGQDHPLILTQHRLPECDSGRLTGRLYADGKLVSVRSDAEKRIVEAVKEAQIAGARRAVEDATDVDPVPGPSLVVGEDIKSYLGAIKQGPERATRHLVNELLQYVQSEEYLRHAARHGT
jgi:uncharacterized protein YdbL (DUF1318 family)